ncbi:MAG: type I glutamate--ammonia ligase [Chloroflexi bacterium]|nr:type I glutamate--ammonia ligase [Chloroflexota bacterium]
MVRGRSNRSQGVGATRPTTPEDVLKLAHDRGIQMVDLKFTDLPGTLQHFTIPVEELTEKLFQEGSGFDGSSIRGFQEIHESDMLVVPDPATGAVDPVFSIPTLSLICDVLDPVTGKPFSRDPRYIAKKAEAFLKASGLADISYWGPELEFFVFDSVRFDQNAHSGYYFVDSDEGVWNSGAPTTLRGGPNTAYRPRFKEGYFPTPPLDTMTDLRSEMLLKMARMGMVTEKHHHEVATAGQAELAIRYDTMARQADNVMVYKYIVKNVALAHGKVATFMPKPLFGDNGTGMHCHQSLWKDGQNLFYNPEGYAGFSSMGLYYIGGLLKHAPALLALVAPTTNSYRRLVPGFEAPVNLVYSMRNRSAAARIPMYFSHPEAKRVEFRCPDPTCNPYLAFAAMLLAGLDGVLNKIDPGQPVDKDIYNLPPEEAARIKQVPGSLEAALEALEEDHDFLLRGGVFTEDVLETWLRFKRTREVDPVRLRPHPYEYHLYLDA